MTSKKFVLSVGLQPQLIDFADPAYAAYPGMTAEKVQGGLDKDIAALNAMGYDAKLCPADFGETAEAVIRATLQQKRYDCVVIGAGLRTIDKNFLLFEKVLNVVHEHAPQAHLFQHWTIRHGRGGAALVPYCLTTVLQNGRDKQRAKDVKS